MLLRYLHDGKFIVRGIHRAGGMERETVRAMYVLVSEKGDSFLTNSWKCFHAQVLGRTTSGGSNRNGCCPPSIEKQR